MRKNEDVRHYCGCLGVGIMLWLGGCAVPAADTPLTPIIPAPFVPAMLDAQMGLAALPDHSMLIGWSFTTRRTPVRLPKGATLTCNSQPLVFNDVLVNGYTLQTTLPTTPIICRIQVPGIANIAVNLPALWVPRVAPHLVGQMLHRTVVLRLPVTNRPGWQVRFIADNGLGTRAIVGPMMPSNGIYALVGTQTLHPGVGTLSMLASFGGNLAGPFHSLRVKEAVNETWSVRWQ